MALNLITFGDPRLTDETGRAIAFPERAIFACAYLFSRALPRISRSELANFLWGDNDGANALANLRQLLARIKARQRELGAVLFSISDTEIEIRRENVACDLDRLQQTLLGNPFHALQGFLDHVSGEFLAGCEASSEKAQFWLEAERAQTLARFGSKLETALADQDPRGNTYLIKDAAFRLLELDAYSEVAYRALMQAFAHDGRLSQAKALFARYKQRLWNDLGAAPDKTMLELTRKLFEAEERSPASSASVLGPEGAAQPMPKASVPLPRLLLLPPGRTDEESGDGRMAQALLEDITISLCRAKTLALIAPHTARQIAGVVDGRGETFRNHRVSYVLETRLQHASGTARLFVNLVHLGDDAVIWAERFDMSPAHLPQSYSQIIRHIIVMTTRQIERKELALIATASQPDAYQYYLLGQQCLKTVDLPDVRRARKSFRAALQAAPEFSNALSGLSRTEHLEWLLTARGDRELLKSAEANALKAIRADGGNPGGYHQLGVIKLYQGGFDESIDAFGGAEEIAPSHADLIADYADTLVHAADPALALEKIGRAIELNPLCPELYWWTAAGANYFLAEYEEALGCIAKMKDRTKVGRLAAACFAMVGDRKSAAREMRKTLKTYPDFNVDGWLSIAPIRESWKREMFREGLLKAGFS